MMILTDLLTYIFCICTVQKKVIYGLCFFNVRLEDSLLGTLLYFYVSVFFLKETSKARHMTTAESAPYPTPNDCWEALERTLAN